MGATVVWGGHGQDVYIDQDCSAGALSDGQAWSASAGAMMRPLGGASVRLLQEGMARLGP